MMIQHFANVDRDEMFQKNMQILPEYIRCQIEHIDRTDVWNHVDITYSKEGYPVCKIKQAENFISMNNIDPLQQANRWSKQLSLENIRTLFIYGCGFGYPLFELLDQFHKDNVFVVFEQNIPIFVAMLHYFDVEPLLRTQRFVFFLGNYEDFSERFVSVISTLDLVFFMIPSIVYTPNSRIFKKEYREIQNKVFSRIQLQVFLFGNDHYDALLGFHNIIENSKEIVANPYISSLQDKYKNVPVFIIANGPSLDHHLQDVKNIVGKGMIFCCESAIISLMKNQIKPDAIFVLERTPQNYQNYFEHMEYPDDISLFAYAGADPRIFKKFPGERIPIFRAENNSLFINQFIGDGTGFYAGTSVAHMALEVAVYMGANPVVLVGQDLAYGPDGGTHSKQSFYADPSQKEIVEKIKAEPVVYLQSNDGKLVRSNQTWQQFKLVFEQMIRHMAVKVINTTERGARIEGTTYDSLPNVIKAYVKNPVVRLDTLLKEEKQTLDLVARKSKLNNLAEELKKYILVYRALSQTAWQRKTVCERLLDDADLGISRDPQLLYQQYENNAQEIMQFMSPRLHPIYFQPLVVYGAYRVNALGPIRSLAKILQALEIQYEVFDYIQFICESLVRNFQIAVEKLVDI